MNETENSSVVPSSQEGRVMKTRKNRINKLKVVTIREDYVAVTGNWRTALILSQFVYWSERVNDFDDLLEEESRRDPSSLEATVPFKNGWIYKTTEQLISELMVDFSRMTIRRDIESLVKKGFLMQRNNPKFAYDRTLQYRVDFIRLALAMKTYGFSLEYKVLQDLNNTIDL